MNSEFNSHINQANLMVEYNFAYNEQAELRVTCEEKLTAANALIATVELAYN